MFFTRPRIQIGFSKLSIWNSLESGVPKTKEGTKTYNNNKTNENQGGHGGWGRSMLVSRSLSILALSRFPSGAPCKRPI